MGSRRIPIIVLAGSDRKAVALPEQGRDKHALTGYKSVEVEIGGSPLVSRVVARLTASEAFSPIYVAGPGEVHRDKVGSARIIDTDSSFGQNIRTSIEHVRRIHRGEPIAVTVCDVLPEPEKLGRLMEQYDACTPCDLWAPMVRAADRGELGASNWKPAYRIVDEPGGAPTRILPGHLVVADVEALRLKFLYRLLDLAYHTRNRSIDQRRGVMVRGVLREMLSQDFLNVLRFRAPSLTWSVLRASIPASHLLRKGEITRRRLEDTLRKILVKRRHRRAFPERRVLLPIVNALFLARDIDTVEEAQELGGKV